MSTRSQVLSSIMRCPPGEAASSLNDMAQGCLEGEHGPDLFALSDEAFEAAVADLKKYWPSYMQYCREEDIANA